MRGSLGEKIGEGACADVHAWAPGQVVKLFKAGVRRRVSWWEAQMTRAVFAAGSPAPEVLGEVTLEGRFGIVLPRLDGPTLLQHYRSGHIVHDLTDRAHMVWRLQRSCSPNGTFASSLLFDAGRLQVCSRTN